jgi:hypothetical protein
VSACLNQAPALEEEIKRVPSLWLSLASMLPPLSLDKTDAQLDQDRNFEPATNFH